MARARSRSLRLLDVRSLPLTTSRENRSSRVLRHLCLPEGFRRGFIYELVYEAKNPRVMAVGLASTTRRTLLLSIRWRALGNASIRFLRTASPLSKRVIMTGASQTGRYCRQFLYTGFHRDEQDRVVVEGLWPHITAARLPINMRFAAPGRAFLQHEEHSLPSYEFPIAYNVMKDAFSDRVDGVLRHCGESATWSESRPYGECL